MESMKLAKYIFGREAFRKVHHSSYKRIPPINKALFDAISTQFALLSDEERNLLKKQKVKFKKSLRQTLADNNTNNTFFKSLTSATGDKKRTQDRHEIVKVLIQALITNEL